MIISGGQQPALPGREDLLVQEDHPGQEDPLGQRVAAPLERPIGRRIAAALIDMVLLTGLFVILSLIIGQTSAGMGSFHISLSLVNITRNGQPVVNISLNGAWAVLYLALLPFYYFALEASIGQTVGKRLLGLRVLRADGRRPSRRAIAGRTLLRLVDGLPVLYLAGFVTMLATGRGRRQRLGDLAAGTAVTRALPVRHRGLAVIPLAIVLVAVAGLSVYRATGGPSVRRATSAGAASTYRAHGVSFDYPAGWQEARLPVDASIGRVRQKLWTTAVVLDQADWIDVAAYRLSPPAPKIPIGPVSPAVKAAFRRTMEQGGRALRAGPEEITMGGMPGLLVRGAGTQDGIPVENTLAFALNGTTEYVVNCEHARAPGAGEVERACGKVLRTFTVTSSAGAASTYRAHGVSFNYPAEWQEGGSAGSVPVGPVRRKLWNAAAALDRWDWIQVAAYRLPNPVTITPAVRTLVTRKLHWVGDVILAGPEMITMGGMPGLLARGGWINQQETYIVDTVVFAFDGTTEYVLTCEHTPANAGQVKRACGQLIRTFKVSKEA
jgi:uncharacterized RDD family membrane protein YckC